MCGTAALDDGVQLAAQLLKAEGLDNVHLEEVQEPVWTRGKEYAELRAPRRRPYALAMLGLGSSIGTGPSGIEADVIVVRNFTELAQRGAAGQVRGKIVVYNQYCAWDTNPTGCYGQSNAYRTQGAVNAAAQGAVASLTRSVTGFSMATPHTGGSTRSTIPAAALTVEDVEMLQRFQDRGQPIRIFLYMEAAAGATVTGHNVVAEIKGQHTASSHPVCDPLSRALWLARH